MTNISTPKIHHEPHRNHTTMKYTSGTFSGYYWHTDAKGNIYRVWYMNSDVTKTHKELFRATPTPFSFLKFIGHERGL